MVIAIISESRSASVRNRDRHHLGTLIAIARNTQKAGSTPSSKLGRHRLLVRTFGILDGGDL
jgi:hypothetical protein